MSNTKFIPRGGEQELPPPFVTKNVQFYCFILPGNQDSIQANICDKYLNHPANGQTDFQVASPFFSLVFCTLGKVICGDLGWMGESEAALWVLTVDRKRERLMWFQPYMLVDGSYAMAIGREIYGFAKSIGWFQFPDSPSNADLLTADTVVLDTFSPETQAMRQRLFEARRVQAGQSLPKTWHSLEDLMKMLVQILESQSSLFKDLRLAFDSADDLIHGRVPMVFLKQFRDVANPVMASYQAIVEAPCKADKFNGGGWLDGDYEITINSYQSHPIQQEFGLQNGPLKPIASFWVNFDMQFSNGIEIWKAPS